MGDFAIIGGVLFIGIFGILTMVYLDNQKRNDTPEFYTRKKKKYGFFSLQRYFKLYDFFSEFFATRGSFRSISSRVTELSIYNLREIKIRTVDYYLMSNSVSLIAIVLSWFIFGDFFTTMEVFAFTVIVKGIVVDKQIASIHYKLLKQLSRALSSLRQSYLKSNSIPDAIMEASVGPLLQRGFEDIYIILTAEGGERKLDEFYASNPFEILQTLAGVCYNINNGGDTRTNLGSSNFLQAVEFLVDEVNLSIVGKALERSKFGILEILPLVPIPLMGIICNYFAGTIPGTSVIYNGPLGYLFKTAILMLSLLGYVVILKVNLPSSTRRDDRNKLVIKLMRIPIYREIVSRIMPKKKARLAKKRRYIRNAISMVNLNHLYGSKLMFSLVAFFVSLLLMISMVGLGKDYIYNNINEMSLVSGNKLTAKEIADRKKLDKEYLAIKPQPDLKKTTAIVKSRITKLKSYDLEMQIQRVTKKYKMYYGTYYKWWMLLVSYIFAFIAWWIPEIMLKSRAWLVKIEAEGDLLQLQTIISILMNTNADTLDTLYWLYRQSRIHKYILMDAYHEYPSNPMLALERLKASATLPEFKSMVEKLEITVSQSTLADAFSDLVTDREHVLRLREISQTKTINTKRSVVGPLALAPMVAVILLFMLFPLGYLGVDAMKSIAANMR